MSRCYWLLMSGDALSAVGEFYGVGEVVKEVVVQDQGDASQQGRVDVLAAQYVIDVAADCVKFACKPGFGASLAAQLMFYHFAYVHRSES